MRLIRASNFKRLDLFSHVVRDKEKNEKRRDLRPSNVYKRKDLREIVCSVQQNFSVLILN